MKEIGPGGGVRGPKFYYVDQPLGLDYKGWSLTTETFSHLFL